MYVYMHVCMHIYKIQKSGFHERFHKFSTLFSNPDDRPDPFPLHRQLVYFSFLSFSTWFKSEFN